MCDYFNNFKLFAHKGKIGLQLGDNKIIESEVLAKTSGHLVMKLTETGDLDIRFDNKTILSEKLSKDLTKIQSGYVTCGRLQGKELSGNLQTYKGIIDDLRFTMNELSRTP